MPFPTGPWALPAATGGAYNGNNGRCVSTAHRRRVAPIMGLRGT